MIAVNLQADRVRQNTREMLTFLRLSLNVCVGISSISAVLEMLTPSAMSERACISSASVQFFLFVFLTYVLTMMNIVTEILNS